MAKEINLAYYKESDWGKLLAFADDRESMHDTWQEWHNSYIKLKNELIANGLNVNDIIVDLDELRLYCFKMGLKNNGETRSEFVTKK